MGKDRQSFLNGAELLHRLLLNPRGWALREIAAHFEISERAVRRYVQRLQESHTLLHNPQGESLIRRVRENNQTLFRVDWERGDLAPKRTHGVLGAMAAMHFSIQLLSFLRGTALGEAIRSTRDTLMTSVLEANPGFATALENVDRMFYVVPDAPKSYEAHEASLEALVHAIAFRREVQFKYRSASSRGGWRVVQPLSLVSYRSALYVAGRASGEVEVKTYAVDRISELTELDRRFAYPSRALYDPAKLFDGAFGIFQDRDTPQSEVTLRFATDKHSWLTPVITERHWHHTQRFERDAHGRLVMHLQVQSLTDLTRWILSYGCKVEVLSPDSLRRHVNSERCAERR